MQGFYWGLQKRVTNQYRYLRYLIEALCNPIDPKFHIRSVRSEQTVTCRRVLFFQVKVIGPGSVPTKVTKDARAVENPGTVTATRAKAMVVVESVPWLVIIRLLKQRLFRGLLICQNCAVALLCSAKTCIDHLMLEVHCAYSLAKEEEGIMMIEAILKRCGCIELKFSKMGGILTFLR